MIWIISYLLMSAWYLSLALELFCICWSSDLILEQLRIVKPKNTMFEVICSMTGRLKNRVLPWVPPETVTVTQQNSFALRSSYADYRVANFLNLKSKDVFFKSVTFFNGIIRKHTLCLIKIRWKSTTLGFRKIKSVINVLLQYSIGILLNQTLKICKIIINNKNPC